MPDDTNRTPIQNAWINFVKSVRLLLVPQTDDRPLDQYLTFRDAVLPLVQSEQFLTELEMAWVPLKTPPSRSKQPPSPPIPNEIKDALLQEIQAVSRMVEVVQTTGKPEETKDWYTKGLGRASIGLGSIKDILADLPPYAKHALTLYKELIDLFRGKSEGI